MEKRLQLSRKNRRHLPSRSSDERLYARRDSSSATGSSNGSFSQGRYKKRAHAHRVPVMSVNSPEPPEECRRGPGRMSSVRAQASFSDVSPGIDRSVMHSPSSLRSQWHEPPTTFSISHKWLAFGHQADFWFRDRFHMMLQLSFRSLVVLLIGMEAVWATVLAILLALLTMGDAERCLGGYSPHWSNYYYFTVETMFTVGYGTPRYPSCVAANM